MSRLSIVACESCILVVEDDPDLRDALTASLENFGCCTAVAADGIDALDRLERCPRPCLSLVDLNMPRLDGGALAELLHGDGRLSGVPVVSMSAGDGRLIPPLVHSHLTKPFELSALAALVRRFCPRRGDKAVAPA
jgi:two-component system, OmpR family, response regulator MprA